MTLGPVMLDLAGVELEAEDRDLLRHPAVGGVILFSRNYESPAQLTALTAEIHALRKPALLIAVDQEGGRVQRFREGFTALPPVHLIGRHYDIDHDAGRRSAAAAGWLMAAELRACGVDLSFAPVLDLDYGVSTVIGDRAFHRSAEVVAELAGRFIRGMRDAGMMATGKHFPGHGAVVADSHLALPEDHRPYVDIAEDIQPYERLIGAGLEAVMVAHVVYVELDPAPAGFSRWWLTEELRRRMRFHGVIFSDDLSMAAAAAMGDMPERARRALAAGCDMILVCNDRPAAISVVESLAAHSEPASQVRLAHLHGRGARTLDSLCTSKDWSQACSIVAHLLERPDLVLDG
ncbi:MAG: beta-N-acetylhexosaminidase [Gammaproteobacteria bacterium]